MPPRPGFINEGAHESALAHPGWAYKESCGTAPLVESLEEVSERFDLGIPTGQRRTVAMGPKGVPASTRARTGPGRPAHTRINP